MRYGKRARRQAAGLQSNSSVSNSTFLNKSDSSVPTGESKKQRSQQTVSTPLTHKEIISHFEFVPRLKSQAEEMDRGDNDTDGASANSTQVLSSNIPDSCTLQLSQPRSQENKGVANEDSMLRPYANGTVISNLAQTVEELRAAISTPQIDNDQVKKKVAEAKKREEKPKSELTEMKFTAGFADQRNEELSNYMRRNNIRIYGVQECNSSNSGGGEDTETQDQREEKGLAVFRDKLRRNVKKDNIEVVHRFGRRQQENSS